MPDLPLDPAQLLGFDQLDTEDLHAEDSSRVLSKIGEVPPTIQAADTARVLSKVGGEVARAARMLSKIGEGADAS